MSEVIVTGGSVEPVFGLQVFNEDSIALIQSADGVSVIARGNSDVAITPENPFDTTSFTVFSKSGEDDIVTAAGNDFVVTAAGDDSIATGIGNDIVLAGRGDDFVLAGEGNDIVTAGRGDDFVFGGEGNDQIFGNSGDDFLYGEGGDDFLSGGDGDDFLFGGDGNDRIAGGAGNDAIDGGAGSDTLIAGAGSDTLTGGPGADKFRFGRDAIKGLDKIVDFNPNEDIIELGRSLIPAANLRGGRLQASDFGVVTSFGAISRSDAKIIYDSSTGLVYYNSGRQGSTPVALLETDKNLNFSADTFRIV